MLVVTIGPFAFPRIVANNPGCLDLYTWLTWRCFQSRSEELIPLFGPFGLAGQLGVQEYERERKARTWIRAVLEEAVEQEFLQKNPAGNLVMPPTRTTCKRFLTAEEYRKMLKTLKGRDRLIFRLFVLCAFRPGKLFALRWRSFRGDAIRIEDAVYRGRLGPTKTKGSAALVISPSSIAKELKAWYKKSGNPAPDAFIFPSERNKPIDAHNYLQRDVLKPAAEKVGIEGLTFQSLRRTFATHFHRVGTVKDQQAQMRHSNAQTTMNIYTQAVSDSLKTAMKEFDKKMSGRF